MNIYWLFLWFLFCSGEFVSSENPEEIRNEQGKLMKSYMNRNVDPCGNFYKFACGRFGKRLHLGDDQISYDALDVLSEKVNKFFKDTVLFNNSTSAPNQKIEKLLGTSEVQRIKDYYMLCRRQKGTKYQPYLKTLNFPGGWPILNNTWDAQHFDWLNMTAQLKLSNVQALFEVIVSPHYQNATRNTIYIHPAEFSFFPPNHYIEPSPAIQAGIVAVIKMAFEGLGVRRRVIAKVTEQILDFETELARIFPDYNDEKEGNEVDELTLDTVAKLFPEIDIKRYFKIVFETDIPESQEVVVLCRSYFTRLVKLLNETDNEVLANYFFYKFTSAIENADEKENKCVDEIINYFGFALGHIYNIAFNDERSNKDAGKIGESIKAEFQEIVANASWIDQNTTEEATTKIANIVMTVGGSSSSEAYEMIKHELLDIDIDLEDYHKSLFNLIAYSVRKNFQKLDKINKNNETDVNTAMVNAFYDSTRNHILIPTNLLQTPTYDYNLPNSVKYGALGSIIGHEITHSLDPSGAGFDSKGSIRDWWSDNDDAEYTKRSQCIEQQYANYTPKIMNVPLEKIKTSTLDENIADNGGLRLAYHAYQKWLHKNPDAVETLPHVNLTNHQLFFLSFAQFYCQKITPAGMIVTLVADEHGLSEYRVIGALTNFEKFSEVFNCPDGSNMNPEKKCRVW